MDINIQVKFLDEKLKEEFSEDQLISDYVNLYNELTNKYKDFIVKGTGYKTNKYHEAKMNEAYNYIKHSDFKRIAKEPDQGYDDNGKPKSMPSEYEYYLSVWSVTCKMLSEKYNKFEAKFDHRYKDKKNNDFDGFLCIFTEKSQWHNINLPNKQRYNN